MTEKEDLAEGQRSLAQKVLTLTARGRLDKAIEALLKRDYTLEEIAEDLEGWV